MPGSRSSLIVSAMTFSACLLALAWIVTSVSDMQNKVQEIRASHGRQGLSLLNSFISQLPDEIPSYPKSVLPADSPAAVFAQTMVGRGEIYRLTLLDQNDRSVFSAGRNSAGVYTPFSKANAVINEAFLLDDMSGLALAIPIDRNGTSRAMAGIVLPLPAGTGSMNVFLKFYPHLIVITVIILLASGSVLMTRVLNRPVNPLFAPFLSLKRHMAALYGNEPAPKGGDDQSEQVDIIVKSLQRRKYQQPAKSDTEERQPVHLEADMVTTVETHTSASEVPSSSATAGQADMSTNSLPLLSSLIEHAFADMAQQRDVDRIEFLSSCRDDIAAIGIAPEDLELLLKNLMLNACDSMPSGGKLVVRAKLATHEAGAESAPGEHLVRIDVLDTGTGLSGKQLSKIFSPSYKPRTLPTEMVARLVHARETIEQAGGKIDAKSRTGKGSCFTVWVPASPAKSA